VKSLRREAVCQWDDSDSPRTVSGRRSDARTHVTSARRRRILQDSFWVRTQIGGREFVYVDEIKDVPTIGREICPNWDILPRWAKSIAIAINQAGRF